MVTTVVLELKIIVKKLENNITHNSRTNATHLCRCMMRKASVSWFGRGSFDMAWYRSALLSSGSGFSAAFIKSCHSVLVTKGLCKEHKKYLIVLHMRWMSNFDKFGTPLPLGMFPICMQLHNIIFRFCYKFTANVIFVQN